MSKYFVFAKVNGEQQSQLMKQYGAQGFPAIRFLAANGQQVYGFDGYEPVDQFVAEMDKARKLGGL